MTESLDDIVAEEIGADAERVVKQNKNKVYNPVVTTAEVADELDVSEAAVREVLDNSASVERKDVDSSEVWW